MTKTGQNFEMWQGDDKILSVTIIDEDNNDQPVDLTGSTITWVMYKRNTDNIVLTKTTGGGGITVTDAVNGLIEVSLDRADTLNLRGTYLHECELLDNNSNRSTSFTGSVTIYKSLANN